MFSVVSKIISFFLGTLLWFVSCSTEQIIRKDCLKQDDSNRADCISDEEQRADQDHTPDASQSNPENTDPTLAFNESQQKFYQSCLDHTDQSTQIIIKELFKVTNSNDCVELTPRINDVVHLDLQDKDISSITILSHLGNLQSVLLSNNRIRDLSPLNSLNLSDLRVGRNLLSHLGAIPQSLETLDISDNQLGKLDQVATLTTLKNLTASRNLISDVSAIGTLSGLQTIDLQFNQIRDLSALSGLGKVQRLDLRFNPVENDTCPVTQMRGEPCIFGSMLDNFSVPEVINKFEAGPNSNTREYAGRSLIAAVDKLDPANMIAFNNAAINRLTNDPTEQVRLLAATQLINHGSTSSADTQLAMFQAALNDSSSRIRDLALNDYFAKVSMDQLTPETVQEAQAQITSQTDPQRRLTAVRIMSIDFRSLLHVRTMSGNSFCETLEIFLRNVRTGTGPLNTMRKLSETEQGQCLDRLQLVLADNSINQDIRAQILAGFHGNISQHQQLLATVRSFLNNFGNELYIAAVTQLAPLMATDAALRQQFTRDIQRNNISRMTRMALNYALGISVHEVFEALPNLATEGELSRLIAETHLSPRIFSPIVFSHMMTSRGSAFTQIETAIGDISRNSALHLSANEMFSDMVLPFIPSFNHSELNLIHEIRMLAVEACNAYSSFCPTRERIHGFPGQRELQETIEARAHVIRISPNHRVIAIFDDLIARMNQMYSTNYDYSRRRPLLSTEVQTLLDPVFADLNGQTPLTLANVTSQMSSIIQRRANLIHWEEQEAIPTVAAKQFLSQLYKARVRALDVVHISRANAIELVQSMLDMSAAWRILRPIYHRNITRAIEGLPTDNSWRQVLATQVEQGINWQLDDLHRSFQAQVTLGPTIPDALETYYQDLVRTSVLSEWDFVLQGLRTQ